MTQKIQNKSKHTFILWAWSWTKATSTFSFHWPTATFTAWQTV